MHEMSLMQGVLEIIEEAAQGGGFSRVKKVRLEIGALSGVDEAAMDFCFSPVMKGTLAEDAVLEIVSKPGEAWCGRCEREVRIGARHDPCPHCGAFPLEVRGGEELRVKELEVE